MLNGNGTIIYIDDLASLCKKFNIESVSNFIIYSNKLDKVTYLPIKFDNITLYSDDINKEFIVPNNVYGKFSYLFFILDNNFLENIDKQNYFNRTKYMMKLRKLINIGMVHNFYSPDIVKVFNDNISLHDLSTFKLFETDEVMEQVIKKPIIEIYSKNVKIIDSELFDIKNMNSEDINER